MIRFSVSEAVRFCDLLLQLNLMIIYIIVIFMLMFLLKVGYCYSCDTCVC